jgi:hypothetical protein
VSRNRTLAAYKALADPLPQPPAKYTAWGSCAPPSQSSSLVRASFDIVKKF